MVTHKVAVKIKPGCETITKNISTNHMGDFIVCNTTVVDIFQYGPKCIKCKRRKPVGVVAEWLGCMTFNLRLVALTPVGQGPARF